jgi:Fe-S oxidoreductase
MLNGEVLTDGWQSEAVHEALDLCLSCKGCKGDCPVQVDMATYKAEFLSHYYEGRLRPRHAYAMGLIHRWARLAAWAPEVANFFSQTPVLRDVAKWIGGIAQERHMPPFAAETFKDWYRRRAPRNHGRPQVILWADTFNNHFHPEVAKAAVEVLEAAGYQVCVPTAHVCCGRPLYDFGMLDQAKELLRNVLHQLQPQIEAGVPVIGLEPSCLTVFRDELTGLMPENGDAQRLKQQSFLLSEFLNREAKGYQPPQLKRKALVHGHCHHRAIMGMKDEEELMKNMGLEIQVLSDTCCGMAGSFGFEAGHYEISQQIGERELLPAVRQTPKDQLIIANGFSCIEQVRQSTDRRPLHLAQVLQMALHEGPAGVSGDYPESRYPLRRTDGRPLSAGGLALLAGAGLSGLLLGIGWGRKLRH